jgi:uncharacterized membrane protein
MNEAWTRKQLIITDVVLMVLLLGAVAYVAARTGTPANRAQR